MDDTWEVLNGLNPENAADAEGDADGDGFDNRREFLAGTDPQNAASTLAIEVERAVGEGFNLHFTAQADRTYSVQFLDDPAAGWIQLTEVSAMPGAERVVSVVDPAPISAHAMRLYRIQTSAKP